MPGPVAVAAAVGTGTGLCIWIGTWKGPCVGKTYPIGTWPEGTGITWNFDGKPWGICDPMANPAPT